jgi:hypothetical protein
MSVLGYFIGPYFDGSFGVLLVGLTALSVAHLARRIRREPAIRALLARFWLTRLQLVLGVAFEVSGFAFGVSLIVRADHAAGPLAFAMGGSLVLGGCVGWIAEKRGVNPFSGESSNLTQRPFKWRRPDS